MPGYRSDYCGAVLLDPDGNGAEVVYPGALRRGVIIDHLWIRLAEVAADPAVSDGIRCFTWNGWRVRGDLRPDRDKYVAREGTGRVRWRF
jgi:hypothetical protein